MQSTKMKGQTRWRRRKSAFLIHFISHFTFYSISLFPLFSLSLFSTPGNRTCCGRSTINFETHAHQQDRHVKRSGGDVEPVVDPSQDYVLMLGYENATHTVMRFKRKLETCDTSYDIAITVSRSKYDIHT